MQSTINWLPLFCPIYQYQQIPCEFQVMLWFTIFSTIGKHCSSHQPNKQMWLGKKYSNGLWKCLNCIPDFLNGRLDVLKNKHVFNSTFLPEIHKIIAMWQATDVVHVEQVLLMFFPGPKPITFALKSLKRNIFFSFSSTAFFPSLYWSLVCLAAFLIHFLRISVEDFSALPAVGRRNNCMLQFFECEWMLLIYEQI